MIRRSVLLSAVLIAAFLAACNGDTTSPADGAAMFTKQAGGTCQDISQQQINDLFPPGTRGDVTSQLAHIRNDVKKGNTADAQNEMFALWQEILNLYYAGTLNGGKSSSTQTKVLTMGSQLYCLVGLDGSSFLVGNPLSSDNKLQVVFPSGSSQDVISGNGNGGTRIDGNTLTAPGTVTLVLITTSFDPFKGPLHTKLDQYGPFFEVQIVPAQSLNKPILVAQCIAGWSGGDPPPTVHLAHNVGAGIEILGLASSFLNCNGGANNGPSAREYFANGEMWNGVQAIGRWAVNHVTPDVAYAGSIGVGGKTSSFSPFGGVDTAVVMEAVSLLNQVAPAGVDVASAPKVRVRTTGASTPLDGANVSFSVTAGGGSLDPGHVTTVNTVTGADGTAAVANWTINAGANTVQANGAFPPPPSGTGVGINGSPVVFSATGGDLIPWQAGGYKYLAGPADHDAGFQAPAFSDAAWAAGQGGFSDHTPSNPYCAIDAEANTAWNSVPQPTDMLLRHTFSLPSGWSTDLKVSVAIDNDIEVFVDGTMVSGEGFVSHEGCATRDSFIFTIPSSVLSTSTTTHVLAIRARDRGVAAYVDARLYVPTP